MTGHHHDGPSVPGVKLTYDDFVLFPDDGMRHEIIDGEHYVSPSPNTRHQGIAGSLHLLIGMWLEAHPVGRLFFAPFDVVFTKFDVVEPDLLYMSTTRAEAVLTELNVQGAPELVIEIGSRHTGKRDTSIKRALYERGGVTEYWFVDPIGETVRVHRRSGDVLATNQVLSRANGDVLTTPLLPGLELPLARIFRE